VDAATSSTMMLPSSVQGLYRPASTVVVMEDTAAATRAPAPPAGATNTRSPRVTCSVGAQTRSGGAQAGIWRGHMHKEGGECIGGLTADSAVFCRWTHPPLFTWAAWMRQRRPPLQATGTKWSGVRVRVRAGVAPAAGPGTQAVNKHSQAANRGKEVLAAAAAGGDAACLLCCAGRLPGRHSAELATC